MPRVMPFACTSSIGEAALFTIAATIQWASAMHRLPAAQRSATLTHITLVLRHRRDETIGVIAKSDQYRPEIGIQFADVPCRHTADPHGHWSFRPFGVH